MFGLELIYLHENKNSIIHFSFLPLPPLPKEMADKQIRLKAAFAAVKGGMPLRQAARDFGIPRTTIRDKLQGRTALELKVRTKLSPEEEKKVHDLCAHTQTHTTVIEYYVAFASTVTVVPV